MTLKFFLKINKIGDLFSFLLYVGLPTWKFYCYKHLEILDETKYILLNRSISLKDGKENFQGPQQRSKWKPKYIFKLMLQLSRATGDRGQ